MSVVVYGLIGLMPGDPIDLMATADPGLTPADVARLKAVYGLDRPLLERWTAWALAALRGDLGYSRLYGQPVVDVLLPRLAATLVLMGTSLVLAVAIAVPLGVAAARRPDGWLDRLVDLLAFSAASVPSFWLALLMIVLFAVELGWLPAGGDGGAAARGPIGRLPYLVLPVATMTLLTIGALVRFVRISVAEALTNDFIRTARAKGCSERRVVWNHAFGHAVPALVTIVALHLGSLVSGALVVETVFAWPGMGKLIYDAVIGNDFSLALAALLLVTATTLLANLAADLAHARLDPRIALDG
ncbi:MAG TPA: ABC transporter permease [Geminicoccaceae bacterium]|nr:ABC transporter permease [Geminicoccus sp.]HMU50682.1 ABC transporter permease [Geminicoccaceae bacterium]